MPASFPTSDQQLQFLTKLQRLFAEGDFTATYKFALLISLAELAVELGADDGSALELTTRQIAEQFVHLYWRQAMPYGNGRPQASPGVLIQNTGAQAAVVSAILEFRLAAAANTATQARSHPGYRELIGRIAQTVSAQPLNYLQNFGGGTDEFLYERPAPGRVRLKAGVGFCLRRFHPLVQQLARSHWVGHIRGNRQNQSILGDADDLEEFLFATPRQSLLMITAALRKLEGARCFYCSGALTEADVDHFVPFSMYPRDIAANFVLAHPGCNRSKSDSLAGLRHLDRWLERLQRSGSELREICAAAGVVADNRVARRVAEWGYQNGRIAGGHAWIESNHYEPIDEQFSSRFDAFL